MAEAAGIRASIPTFIEVTARLSNAITTQFGSTLFMGPSSIHGVRKRLEGLESALTRINRTFSLDPEWEKNPATQRYWAGKGKKLKSDFAEFGDFAAQLTANIGDTEDRTRWTSSHEDRATRILGPLTEDSGVLLSLFWIMESYTLRKICSTREPAITAPRRGAQTTDRVNTTMPGFAEYYNTLRSGLGPCIHASCTPQDNGGSSSQPACDCNHGNNYYAAPYTAPTLLPGRKERRREKRRERQRRRREGGDPQESIQDAVVPVAVGHSEAGNDRARIIPTHEEREGVENFWFPSKGKGTGRWSLVKVEKEVVRGEVEEQQEHSRSHYRGRKRTTIEAELEVPYGGAYSDRRIAPYSLPLEVGFAGRVASPRQQNSMYAQTDFPLGADPARRVVLPLRPSGPPSGYYHSQGPCLDEMEKRDEKECVLDSTSPEHDTRPDSFNLGSNLTVKGDILTGAGDFLENDGKKVGGVMEKLTERRIKSEEEAENTCCFQ